MDQGTTSKNDQEETSVEPTSAGALTWNLTLTWIAYWAGFAVARRESLSGMPLNELGDFLAGFAAPLAFGWLVRGFFLQGEQLAAQRSDLKAQLLEIGLQREEMANSVHAQQDLAATAKKEVDHLIDESRFNREQAMRAAQPVFVINESTQPNSAGTMRLVFRNDGKPANSVSVFITKSDGVASETKIVGDTTFKATLAEGELFPLEINVVPRFGLILEIHIDKLRLQYTDQMMIRREQVFSITQSKGGPVSVMPNTFDIHAEPLGLDVMFRKSSGGEVNEASRDT